MCRSSRNGNRQRDWRLLDVPRLSVLPPENAAFDSFVISPESSQNRIYRVFQREDNAVGAALRFGGRQAPAGNGKCRVTVLVAGQPSNRFLHPFQAEGHPR